MCHLGEVLKAALPSGLKLSSESKIQQKPGFKFNDELERLGHNERLVLEALQTREKLTYTEVEQITGLKNVYALIQSLVRKEAILVFEEIRESFRPSRVKKVRLNTAYLHEEKMNQLFDSLIKKAKQTDTVLQFIQAIGEWNNRSINQAGINKSSFLALPQVSTSSFNTLKQKGVFEEFEEIIPRFSFLSSPNQETEPIALTQKQTEVRDEILTYFQRESIFLLHGVTGSGKTAIYIDLIKQVLDNGQQVLYLLPEIALTSQIVKRLSEFFGDHMGIYHSRFSDNERVEVWNGVLEEKVNFVIGVRSAIFLPFNNLGLIILDEEHDGSFKQHEPPPRYNGKESALQLARLQGAKVLLGTATPSLETYFQAKAGRYGYSRLTERYGGATFPTIELIDLKKAKAHKELHEEFTQRLLDEISLTLDDGKQVMLFQNRRGYAPNLICVTCGHVFACTNCSVSLTYHKFSEELRCHYCGFKEKVPTSCIVCNSAHLELHGYGTQKLEEKLRHLLPDASIERMDQDTTRGKYRFEQILADFDSGKTQVLIGTQMITKGLDFERVALVGVLDADRMMYYPDFRAIERTYQLLNQVAGRSGRSKDPGKVLIQTWQPQHWVFDTLEPVNKISFYDKELLERQTYEYPPFVRIIEIIVRSDEKPMAREASYELGRKLKAGLGSRRVLGPVEPMISKIRNKYLFSIIIKLERKGLNLTEAKNRIKEIIRKFGEQKDYKKVQLVVDVDPR
jgi:primosomal protein N' (replication factor Y)